MSASPTLFVSGASGHLGRRIVELLLERGQAGRVVAATRHPEALADLRGVEVRRAGFDDVPALTAALAGVDRALLISTTPADEGRTRLHLDAVAAAKAAGVGHVIYTSMPLPEPPSPIPFAPQHLATEEAIRASGIPYTILRMMWYAENLLGSLPQVLASGQWFTAAGDGTQAHVAREDCARACAGALLAAGESRTLTVTGPASLTIRQIAAVATEVTGRPIAVVDLDEEQLAAGLRQAGVPEGVIQGFILPFERNTRLGRTAMATDAVEQLWGEKAMDLRTFLARNRAALG